MGCVVSIHEYELRAGVDPAEFERAVRDYWATGHPALPGLVERWLLWGVKGAGKGRYAAAWIYADRAAWEAIWGSPEQPVAPERYPAEWVNWEQFLARFLDRPPDCIVYTAYERVQ